jgi:hypothetical protein
MLDSQDESLTGFVQQSPSTNKSTTMQLGVCCPEGTAGNACKSVEALKNRCNRSIAMGKVEIARVGPQGHWAASRLQSRECTMVWPAIHTGQLPPEHLTTPANQAGWDVNARSVAGPTPKRWRSAGGSARAEEMRGCAISGMSRSQPYRARYSSKLSKARRSR